MTPPSLPADQPWQILSSAPHELGEGLRLDGRTLRWVDLLRGELHERPLEGAGSARRTHAVGAPLGMVERDRDGDLLALLGTGVARLHDDGTHEVLGDTGLDPARHRVNDGTLAPDGTVWFGTMVHDGSPAEGALWRWDPRTRRTERLLSGIDVPNGPVFDGAGNALLADSAGGRILRLSGEDGTVLDTVAEVDGGSPDGMHRDADGRLWSAVWGAARVDVHGAGGAEPVSIPVPASQPTSVLLAPGDEPLLIVTSALLGLEDPGPFDGHTFAAPAEALRALR